MKAKAYIRPLTVVLPVSEECVFCNTLSGGGGTIEPIEEGELE